MYLRDYFAAIRRRYYVFFTILLGIVGAHVVWVTYIEKPMFEASSHISVQTPKVQGEQIGTFATTAWVRTPTPFGIQAALGERDVQARIVDVLAERRNFGLREFTRPPLSEHIDAAIADFQENYPPESALNVVPAMLSVEANNNAGTVHLTARTKTRESSLAVAWAAAEAIVQHFRDRMDEDLEYLESMLLEESENLHRELQKAEAKWVKVVEDIGFDPINREKRLEQDIEVLQNESDRLGAEQRELARRYREMVQARPLNDGSSVIVPVEKILAENGRITGLEQRILSLKLKKDEMLERWTRSHPEVIELQQRIKALEDRFPEIVREELGTSLIEFSDREINEILYRSRKVALDREIKQEQIAALKRKVQDVATQAVVLFPVKRTCEDVREKYQTALAMANNVKFLGATNLFGQVRILDPGRSAYLIPVRGKGMGPLTLTVILALLAAFAAVYILEYIDLRVKNERDVTRFLSLPLLGVLPRVDRRELTQISAEGTPVAERFNTAATLVRTTARELDLHTFAVCSAVAREGKTTVSLNMAAALARKGTQVVLIDADMRMPQIHRLLGLSNEFGLSTLLSGWISPREVIDGIMGQEGAPTGIAVVSDALQETAVPGLRVLTSGPQVHGAAQLIESDRFQQVIRYLTESVDFVIFDTPPIDRVGDALTVASLVDGCIFVVGAGQCEQQDVTWAKHLLTNVQANLLGAVLNRYAQRRGREAEYYYGKKRASAHA